MFYISELERLNVLSIIHVTSREAPGLCGQNPRVPRNLG